MKTIIVSLIIGMLISYNGISSTCYAKNTELNVQAFNQVQLDTLAEAFDFWVGEWEVSWLDPDSTLVKGRNNVVKILDEKVIQENFVDTSRNFKGTSISVYNPQSKTWHQTWADNTGGYYTFIGEIEGDKRIFKTEEKDSRGAMYRMVFSDIEKDSFKWEWQGFRDGFEDWKTVWEIKYKRIE